MSGAAKPLTEVRSPPLSTWARSSEPKTGTPLYCWVYVTVLPAAGLADLVLTLELARRRAEGGGVLVQVGVGLLDGRAVERRRSRSPLAPARTKPTLPVDFSLVKVTEPVASSFICCTSERSSTVGALGAACAVKSGCRGKPRTQDGQGDALPEELHCGALQYFPCSRQGDGVSPASH